MLVRDVVHSADLFSNNSEKTHFYLPDKPVNKNVKNFGLVEPTGIEPVSYIVRILNFFITISSYTPLQAEVNGGVNQCCLGYNAAQTFGSTTFLILKTCRSTVYFGALFTPLQR